MLQLTFDPQGADREAALGCEADVFGTWFGNSAAQLADEYGPYDETSVFIVLSDEANDVVGCCRLILPSRSGIPGYGDLLVERPSPDRGLKTLRDVAAAPWHLDVPRSLHAAGVDASNTWDIATLGVRRRDSGFGMLAAAALYHGLVVASRVNGVDSVVAMIDESVRALLQNIGMVLHLLPGAAPAPYLGSVATAPVYGNCAAMVSGQRRMNPEAHRLISLGVGLDGICIPDDEAFLLPRSGDVQPMSRTLDLTHRAGLGAGRT